MLISSCMVVVQLTVCKVSRAVRTQVLIAAILVVEVVYCGYFGAQERLPTDEQSGKPQMKQIHFSASSAPCLRNDPQRCAQRVRACMQRGTPDV